MNVPIVYLCVFSIFLSLNLFFYNKGYQGANRFLSGYLFCTTLFLLSQYFLIFSTSISIIAFFITVIPSLYFLIGPFAYFYVRSLLRDNVKLSKTDFRHLFPFLLVFIGTLPFLFSTWEHKCLISQKIIANSYMSSNYNINFLVPKIINQLIRPPFAIFYFVLIFRTYLKNKKAFTTDRQARTMKIWLVVFVINFSLTALFYIIVQLAYYLNIKFLLNHSSFYYLINSIAMLYLAINFSLVLFPQILYGLPISKLVIEPNSVNQDAKQIRNLTNSTFFTNKNKLLLVNTFFSNEYKIEIEIAIQNWTTEQKFLDKNASLSSVAIYTNIPAHHLSYYFNSILKIKYTDWRNSLRVEFAKKQLDSGFTKSATLFLLSFASGFNSQYTFNRSFKRIVGCTPSDYLKTIQQH